MARKRFNDMNCAAAQALEQIGDWWTLLIVRESFYGTSTFSEFQERLGIAKNILTERLNALVDHDVMQREQTKPGVDRYSYRLTPKGEALLPVLVSLMQWGDEWIFAGKGPLRVLDATERKPIRPVAVESSDGRRLKIDDLRFKPGRGADESTLGRFRRMGHGESGS
jgi:DNA-binding HxlR family transcriptional regulator